MPEIVFPLYMFISMAPGKLSHGSTATGWATEQGHGNEPGQVYMDCSLLANLNPDH